MNSFGYGNRNVQASSIQEGLAICQELDRLDALKYRREYLRSIKHGHKFNYDLRCSCGITDKEYFYDEFKEMCINALQNRNERPSV